mmetsp:Transcript_39965/g.51502  ORF Transcript_39965/g.51502 Transcript_39965/m.51502 type:complete len:97 (+) Transcript_39965:647-937(+)
MPMFLEKAQIAKYIKKCVNERKVTKLLQKANKKNEPQKNMADNIEEGVQDDYEEADDNAEEEDYYCDYDDYCDADDDESLVNDEINSRNKRKPNEP